MLKLSPAAPSASLKYKQPGIDSSGSSRAIGNATFLECRSFNRVHHASFTYVQHADVEKSTSQSSIDLCRHRVIWSLIGGIFPTFSPVGIAQTRFRTAALPERITIDVSLTSPSSKLRPIRLCRCCRILPLGSSQLELFGSL